MKKLFLSTIVFAFAFSLNGQNRILKQFIEFSMPGENGSNGASVVYHPVQKKYYASMAGNANFPFSVFDLKGTLLTNEDITAGFDVRGMWYNNKTKTIQANGYNDFGWTNFKLDAAGNPTSNEVFIEGLKQPTEQSVGVFNNKLQQVYFLNELSITQYDLKGNEVKVFPLYPKNVLDDEVEKTLPSDYNHTAIYTAVVKGEIGLLNNTDKTIELYNLATGKPTFKWKLPDGIPDNSLFNFAYSNDIVWLFDKALRTWIGYK
jgi:hypothetical protein